MFLTKTYSIIDAKYYASNSRINNEGVPYNNDRKIFASTYTLSLGEEIHFRLKTDPTIAIMGIGSSQGADCVFVKNTNGTYTLQRNCNPVFWIFVQVYWCLLRTWSISYTGGWAYMESALPAMRWCAPALLAWPLLHSLYVLPGYCP